jgi:PAS domain S-box-containing protein
MRLGDRRLFLMMVGVYPERISRERERPKEEQATDIARLNELAEELDASKARARAILESALDCIISMDQRGRIIEFNPAAEKTFSCSSAEAVGKLLADVLFPPSSREKHRQGLADYLATGEIPLLDRRMEISAVRANGTEFPIELTVTRVRGKGPLTFTGIIRDLTERKRAEEGLSHLASIVESSGDAIIGKTLDGTVLSWNTGAERIYGYSAEEMRGRPIFLIVPPERGHEAQQILERIKRGERVEHFETLRLKKDGRKIDISLTVSPIKDSAGKIIAASAIGRDITERKRAEEVLQRQAAELLRSNAELEQFCNVASHDLQEPLRMVASYTKLLARRYQGRLDKDADEFIAYAVDGATRMQTLIKDLLRYSRVETRSKVFEPTDAGAALKWALANLRRAIEETGAIISSDPLPTVIADGTQLGQVFQNLIGNAIKFRSDRPRVHLGVERKEAEFLFWVRDNGIGIAPQFRERVFVIFPRLHAVEEHPGTGIGLAICKKIVERHGGRIWVESEPGEGATFYFTIPIIIKDEFP